MSYIIALTGGICSGKTTVANIFYKFPGVSIIDTDLIAKNITQPESFALLSIIKYFGSKILLSNGTLDRYTLKKRIFFNSIDRKWLEKLLHPLIQKETQKKIKECYYTSLYIIWVVPLLIENNLQKKADRILVVDVDPNIQLHRIMNRDKIDKQYAKKILLSQSTRQNRLKYAHDIIINNNTNNTIKSQIFALHQYYSNKKTSNI